MMNHSDKVPLPHNKSLGFPPGEENDSRCFTINIPGDSSLTSKSWISRSDLGKKKVNGGRTYMI